MFFGRDNKLNQSRDDFYDRKSSSVFSFFSNRLVLSTTALTLLAGVLCSFTLKKDDIERDITGDLNGYPHDVFGTLENPIYSITKKEPLEAPNLITSLLNSKLVLSDNSTFGKLVGDDFNPLRTSVYESFVKLNILSEDPNFNDAIKNIRLKKGENGCLELKILDELENLVSSHTKLIEKEKALLTCASFLDDHKAVSSEITELENTTLSNGSSKDNLDYSECLRARIYAERVFVYLTGKPLPDHISFAFVENLPDYKGSQVEGNANVVSGKINIVKDNFASMIETLLHELGHQIANNSEEEYISLGISDERRRYLRAREEASAYAFAIAGAEVLKQKMVIGDSIINNEISANARNGVLYFAREYYSKKAASDEVIEDEHYLGAAMADAALFVFGDPLVAYNHLATAKELDPRITDVIETLISFKKEKLSSKDFLFHYKKRIFECNWLALKVKEVLGDLDVIDLYATRLDLVSNQGDSIPHIKEFEGSIVRADRLNKFATLINLIPPPNLTNEGLKDVKEVAKYYPRLDHSQHLLIVQFAKDFKEEEISINKHTLVYTAVDCLGSIFLELADKESGALILEELTSKAINYRVISSYQALDHMDNDSDANIDYSDSGLLDDDGVFYFNRDEYSKIEGSSGYHMDKFYGISFGIIKMRVENQPWEKKVRLTRRKD